MYLYVCLGLIAYSKKSDAFVIRGTHSPSFLFLASVVSAGHVVVEILFIIYMDNNALLIPEKGNETFWIYVKPLTRFGQTQWTMAWILTLESEKRVYLFSSLNCIGQGQYSMAQIVYLTHYSHLTKHGGLWFYSLP